MADQRNNVASKSGRLATTLSITPIVLSFLNAAVAITIIGLAADSIAWAGGRGSEESNTVYAIVIGDYGYGESTSDTWFTRMHYLPQYYDTQTFSALIAGSVICVIAGLIAGPLSIASRISKVRPNDPVASTVSSLLTSTGSLAHHPSFLHSTRGRRLPSHYHRPRVRAGSVQ